MRRDTSSLVMPTAAPISPWNRDAERRRERLPAGRYPFVVNRRASRRTPRRHQVVGLLGVCTHTSKNVVRSWPETSSKTASKSSVVAVESS
jgi:hypothetical protein